MLAPETNSRSIVFMVWPAASLTKTTALRSRGSSALGPKVTATVRVSRACKVKDCGLTEPVSGCVESVTRHKTARSVSLCT